MSVCCDTGVVADVSVLWHRCCCWCQCVVTGVVAGVSVLWHRCCCWCQCVVTQVLLLVSVRCDTGVVTGVSVL